MSWWAARLAQVVEHHEARESLRKAPPAQPSAVFTDVLPLRAVADPAAMQKNRLDHLLCGYEFGREKLRADVHGNVQRRLEDPTSARRFSVERASAAAMTLLDSVARGGFALPPTLPGQGPTISGCRPPWSSCVWVRCPRRRTTPPPWLCTKPRPSTGCWQPSPTRAAESSAGGPSDGSSTSRRRWSSAPCRPAPSCRRSRALI